jgi:hypothetical protein
LFSIGVSTDLESKRLADEPLEGASVAAGGPELELGVASDADLEQAVLAAIVELHGADGLLMAAIEALGEPQDRGERADARATLAPEAAEALVAPLRRRLAVVAGDEGDGLDLFGVESPQIAVAD